MDGEVIVYDISIPSGKAVFINPSYTCKHLGCVWQVEIIVQANNSLRILMHVLLLEGSMVYSVE